MSLPAFNRVLAKHLARALKTGTRCDEDLVMHCYATARRDVKLPSALANDPLTMNIRVLCIAHDLQALQHNEARLRMLSLAEAENEIFRLLNPESRVAEGNSKTLSF